MKHRTFIQTLVGLLAFVPFGLFPAPTLAASLLEMSEKLDKLDQLDFVGALQDASNCTRRRDFPCAERKLQQAKKLIGSTSDKQRFVQAQQQLVAERNAVEAERLAELERQRVAAEEERLARQAEKDEYWRQRRLAQEQSDNESSSSSRNFSAFAQVLSQLPQAMNDPNAYGQFLANNISPSLGQSYNSASTTLKNNQEFDAKWQAQRAEYLRQQEANKAAAEREARAAEARRNEIARNTVYESPGAGGVMRSGAGSTPSQRSSQVASAAQEPLRATANRTDSNKAQQSAGVNVAVAPPLTKKRSPDEPDDDGCLEAIGWCTISPSIEQKGTETTIRFTNNCPFRVYAILGGPTSKGQDSSGADGVAPGKKTSWTIYDGIGKGSAQIVGSIKWENDGICRFRNDGFRVRFGLN